MSDDKKNKKSTNRELIKKVKKENIKVERPDKKNKYNKPNKENKQKKKVYHDYSLVFAIFFLIVFGLIMIYSASFHYADKTFKDAAYFVRKQFIYSMIGIVLILIIAYIPKGYVYLIKLSYVIYGASVFFVGLVLVLGRVTKGSKRWLNFRGVNVQPSEFAKIAIIILFSYLLVKYKKDLYSKDKKVANFKLFILFLYAVFPTILVVIENLSTAIIIFMIAFCMSFLGTSMKKWHAIGVASMLGLMLFTKKFIKLIYGIGFRGYRFQRLLVWIEPEKYSRDGGYQVVQGFYSIGSGGLFGKGLGQGLQKFFLPESQNDMIFAIIVEELGLFGALILLSLFTFIIIRMMKIVSEVRSSEGRYLVIGVIIHISLQVIMNIAVVTGVLPNTGVSFPFISYGGSSIVALLIEMGIVLNVARTIKVD